MCSPASAPTAAHRRALPAAPCRPRVVEGARKRFKAALGSTGAPRSRRAEELAHLANGALALAVFIDMADYHRRIPCDAAASRVCGLTFSAEKSLSVAWALAPDRGGTRGAP